MAISRFNRLILVVYLQQQTTFVWPYSPERPFILFPPPLPAPSLPKPLHSWRFLVIGQPRTAGDGRPALMRSHLFSRWDHNYRNDPFILYYIHLLLLTYSHSDFIPPDPSECTETREAARRLTCVGWSYRPLLDWSSGSSDASVWHRSGTNERQKPP